MLTYFWNFFTTIVSGTINLLRLNNWNVRGIGRVKEADFRQCSCTPNVVDSTADIHSATNYIVREFDATVAYGRTHANPSLPNASSIIVFSNCV